MIRAVYVYFFNGVRVLLLGMGGLVLGLGKRFISGEAGRPVGRSGMLHARSAVPSSLEPWVTLGSELGRG